MDFYELLEVDYDASPEQIRSSYHRLRERCAGDPDQLRAIREAWSQLSDPELRSRYDRQINLPALRARQQSQRTLPRHKIAKTEIYDPTPPRSNARPARTEVMSSTPHSQSQEPDGTPKSYHLPSDTEIIASAPPSVLSDKTTLTSLLSVDETETRVHRTEIVHNAQIDVMYPDGTCRPYSLSSAKTRIGRRQDNDIVLPDPENYVSRCHAYVLARDGRYYIVDNKSRNGTRVSGCEIATDEPVQLHDGDTIEIEDLILRFRLLTSV